MHHLVKELGDGALKDFSLTGLQAFLEQKANAGLSFSVVDHLRWDLSAIFEMAMAEKMITSNPATRLYTPKNAPAVEVNIALGAVELREEFFYHGDLRWIPPGRNARAAETSRVGGCDRCKGRAEGVPRRY